MRLLSNFVLALLCLAIMATRKHTLAQAGGLQGCCTSYSKVSVLSYIRNRGGAVQCRWQEITERCNINAVVLKWRCRQICMDPNNLKTRKQIESLCSKGKVHKGVRNISCLHRTKPMI